jgi:hypothetical protein
LAQSRAFDKLQAALPKGTRPARTGPLDAFKLARRKWQDAERVDMSALARRARGQGRGPVHRRGDHESRNEVWLAEEGEAAMRLLTLRKPGYQARLVGWHERLLHEETAAGRLELAADLHEVAYVIVRLIESYVYLDFSTGEEPEPGRAEPILRMLLR